ncbi:hypothetical protein [Microbacterium sp.]|uniref:hypothetical protein n=1 Tax=Microbacterium sp. TaxID=51671 RepID=UPI003F6F2B1D
MPLRFALPMEVPSNVLVAILVLPMAAAYLKRYVGAVSIAVAAIVAVVSGLLLALAAAPERLVSTQLLVPQTLRVLGIALVLAVLLWARSVIGLRQMIFLFGVGALANLLVIGVNTDNVWKFSLSVPVTILVLSLPWVYGRRLPQVVAALVLTGLCVAFDSRSAAGFMLIAIALTLTQSASTGRTASTAARRWMILLRFAAIGVGAYFALQGAILEGLLGEVTQERTQAQLATTGSALIGGRPELGASVALIAQQPWGYGAGVLPTRADVVLAQTGMSRLGYDPNNGYVTNYMFGDGFEVHSVLGDMWILYGLGGLLLVVVFVVAMIRGLAHSMALGIASTIAVYLVSRTTWDIAFSPLYTSLVLLPLTLAAVLEDRRPEVGGLESVGRVRKIT